MMIVLIVWSAAAFVWWGIALLLLSGTRRQPAPLHLPGRPAITVFKPLPPVRDDRELARLAAAVDSFAAQLEPQDQLLVGIAIEDETRWRPAVQRWRTRAPQACIDTVAQPAPVHCANPKVAWQEVLAERARGDLWLWSDADVTAPAGFLNALAGQLVAGDSHAVTAPYCIRDLHQGCEVLDALFVNVEFLPGTLLLGQLNRRSHAYGAAILFRAETFRARANWTELGAALADDNALGRQLQPVQLARTLAATFTQPSGWLAAWRHYYRWQKTVRWCQPGGFAALLVLMPVFGWSAAGAFSLSHVAQLVGLGTLWGGEILVTLAACGLVRCRLTLAAVPGIVLWPLLRPVTWLLVWLPLPVVWSGRKPKWSAPQQA